MRRRVRTFVAIELPPEVRSRACQLIDSLRRSSEADVRWVAPDQLHWTLKFLGDVDLLEIPDICRRLSEAVAPLAPFDVDGLRRGRLSRRSPSADRLARHARGARADDRPARRRSKRRWPISAFARNNAAFGPTSPWAGSATAPPAAGTNLPSGSRSMPISTPASRPSSKWPSFPASSGPKGPIYEPLGHAELAGSPRARPPASGRGQRLGRVLGLAAGPLAAPLAAAPVGPLR